MLHYIKANAAFAVLRMTELRVVNAAQLTVQHGSCIDLSDSVSCTLSPNTLQRT